MTGTISQKGHLLHVLLSPELQKHFDFRAVSQIIRFVHGVELHTLCMELLVQFPAKGLIDKSTIILPSLFVFPMLGFRHSLLRHCNISNFPKVECTFSNTPTCVLLPVGGHYLVLLALTFR